MIRVCTPCGDSFWVSNGWQWVPADMSTAELVDSVRASGSHYFDRDTLRWFGCRNFSMYAPGVSVELQAKAPGDRYAVRGWDVREGVPVPVGGCRHGSLREARACALRTAREGFTVSDD